MVLPQTYEERMRKQLGEIEFREPKDYVRLFDVIPDGEFTASEFAKANKLRGRYPWYALRILQQLEMIEQCGKQGRAFLYRRTDRPSEEPPDSPSEK